MARVIDLTSSVGSNLYFSIAGGQVPGQTLVHKFGNNKAIGTTLEDIWTVGGTLTHQTTAYPIYAVSTATTDTAAGNGARTITIYGLDSSFNEINETITLAGTTNSSVTSLSFIRVFRAIVNTVGLYGGSNLGTISIKENNTNTTQAAIPLVDGRGGGQSQMSHYTIPAGYKGAIIGMHASVATSKSVNYSLQIRERADDTVTPSAWRTLFHIDGLEGSNIVSPPAPLLIPEKTDIRVSALVSTGSAQGSFDYQMILTSLGAGS